MLFLPCRLSSQLTKHLIWYFLIDIYNAVHPLIPQLASEIYIVLLSPNICLSYHRRHSSGHDTHATLGERDSKAELLDRRCRVWIVLRRSWKDRLEGAGEWWEVPTELEYDGKRGVGAILEAWVSARRKMLFFCVFCLDFGAICGECVEEKFCCQLLEHLSL